MKGIISKIINSNIKPLVEGMHKNIFARQKKKSRKTADTDTRPELSLHQKPKSPPSEPYKGIFRKIINFNIKPLVEGMHKKIFARQKKKSRKTADTDTRPELILHRNPKSPASEAYRILRTNIQYSSTDKRLKSIVVTSSGPREGKTTTVLNLGCAFAQANKRTLIVDSDLRNTSFHRLFNLNNDIGFSSVILGHNRIEEAVHRNVLVPNLNVLTSGPRVPNPADVIELRNTADFMDTAKRIYDIIIFDSPPTLAVTDAKLLSRTADGVILVVKCGSVTREVASRSKESLKEVNANIIGVILNDIDSSKHGYYYYHKYYYSYYHGKEKQPEPILHERPLPKVEVRQRKDIAEKKDLFIPDSSDKDVDIRPPSSKSGSIISMLSEEEKKDVKQRHFTDKKWSEKNPALGRKTVFFEEADRSITKEEKPDKQDKNKSSLGKKDIFKDL